MRWLNRVRVTTLTTLNNGLVSGRSNATETLARLLLGSW